MTATENLITGRIQWDGEPTEPIFEARYDPTDRWNGFLRPYLDRANAEAVAKFNNALDDSAKADGYDSVDTFRWDGDNLIMHPSDAEDDEHDVTITPVLLDGVPYYDFGPYGWTWQAFDPGPREIVIRVEVRATSLEDEPFGPADLLAAVRATLHEVFPYDDGLPVVPTVEEVPA